MKKRKFRRAVCAALCVCLLGAALAGCQAQTGVQEASAAAGEDRPVVRVGVDVFPPYDYTDATGQMAGIDAELAREAFGRMGYDVEFVRIDWENKRELVESGEISCIWCSFSMDGREEDYQWAGPYMISQQVVAVIPGSDIYELSDLAGKNVAVQATTKPEELFLNHDDPTLPVLSNVFAMQDRELIYSALSKGYVDAVAAHRTSILQYMADYDVEYRILDEPLLTVGLGVAFSKNDTSTLCSRLNEALDQMRADGTTAQIIGGYLDDPESYLQGVDVYGG